MEKRYFTGFLNVVKCDGSVVSYDTNGGLLILGYGVQTCFDTLHDLEQKSRLNGVLRCIYKEYKLWLDNFLFNKVSRRSQLISSELKFRTLLFVIPYAILIQRTVVKRRHIVLEQT